MEPEEKGYVFIKSLGRGAQGSVGLYSKNDELFAIKYIVMSIAGKDEGIATANDVKNEIDLLRQVVKECPGMIAPCIYDTWTDAENGTYIVMEFIDGHDIFETMGVVHSLGLGDDHEFFEFVMKLLRQTLVVLNSFHAVGIVHGDIKYENTKVILRPVETELVTPNELSFNYEATPMLVDFGLSCYVGECNAKTDGLWVAPEFWYNDTNYHRKSKAMDIYALGLTFIVSLIAMSSGYNKPIDALRKYYETNANGVGNFTSTSVRSILMAKGYAPRVVVTSHELLNDVLNQMISVEPESRPSASQLIQMIDRSLVSDYKSAAQGTLYKFENTTASQVKIEVYDDDDGGDGPAGYLEVYGDSLPLSDEYIPSFSGSADTDDSDPFRKVRKTNWSTEYTTLNRLGRGAYGTVELVENVGSSRILASKSIDISQMSKSDKLLTLHEIKMLEKVSQIKDNCPGSRFAVCYVDHFIDPDPTFPRLYVLMEYIPGTTLDHTIKTIKKFFQIDETLMYDFIGQLFLQCLKSLNEIHLAGIVHGDVKPDNIRVRSVVVESALKGRNTIVVESKLTPIFVDFGLSCTSRKTCEMLGTAIRYIAPEYARQRLKTRQTDLYALGLSFLECILHMRGEQSLDVQLFGEELPDTKRQSVLRNLIEYSKVFKSPSNLLNTIVDITLDLNPFSRDDVARVAPLQVKDYTNQDVVVYDPNPQLFFEPIKPSVAYDDDNSYDDDDDFYNPYKSFGGPPKFF